MKKPMTYSVLALLFTGMLTMQACKKDEPDPPAPPAPDPVQFVANNSSFEDWMNWPLVNELSGADPGLGMAHGGNDETVTRRVYIKDGQTRVGGTFPQGTILVKHSSNPDNTVDEYTAMVKRGGNYDTDFNNWEYFMLTPTAEIAVDGAGNPMRGNVLMGGMCRSCHGGAAAQDYVFTP